MSSTRLHRAWPLVPCLLLVACGEGADGVPGGVADTGALDTALPEASEPGDTLEPDASAPDTSRPDIAPPDADTVGGDTLDDSRAPTEPDTTPDAQDDAQPPGPPPGCAAGSIVGAICPRGSWSGGVRVRVEATWCNGEPVVVETTTDKCGDYELTPVPVGVHDVIFETGSYTTRWDSVAVEADATTELFPELCLKDGVGCSRSAEIAVLTGAFDDVQVVLDGLGIIYVLYEGDSADLNPNPQQTGYELLLDRSELLQFDILIINSGEWYRLFDDPERAGELAAMRANLDDYVRYGGSILVTDWASWWVEGFLPGAVHFFGDPEPLGVFHEPGEPRGPMVGASAAHVPARVESDAMRDALGTATVTLGFGAPMWVVPTGAHFQADIHLRAEHVAITREPYVLHDVPLFVSYRPTPTSGTIHVAAFHLAVQSVDQMEDLIRFVLPPR